VPIIRPVQLELSVLVSQLQGGLEYSEFWQKECLCRGLWGSFQEAVGHLEQSHGPSTEAGLE